LLFYYLVYIYVSGQGLSNRIEIWVNLSKIFKKISRGFSLIVITDIEGMVVKVSI
jgi:hypothetical protein